MSSFGGDTPALIRTKLHRPRLGQGLITRPHLIQRLNQGVDRKLTLFSAQAGAGKSTLLVQWLQQCPQRNAWLSLDEEDNSLTVFVYYLCAAIRTVFAEGCEQVLDLLNAPATPSPRVITTSLVNELINLCDTEQNSDAAGCAEVGLIIALDDYHLIKERTVHELISQLVMYLPRCVHLAISTRTDPPLPLVKLRAKGEMSEFRTNDFQFTREEAKMLVEITARRKLDKDSVDLLNEKTEGWVVGLRLAALSMRDLTTGTGPAQRPAETGHSFIADYMVSEVLTQQSPVHQDFLLRSAIFNRFNAELCDAVLYVDDEHTPLATQTEVARSRTILGELGSANMFLVALDHEEQWFRYHHLFRDLLRHRLQRQHAPEYVNVLHGRASQWYEENGLIDEALSHAFSSGDLERAAGIVARQRYALMNQARWQRLQSLLERFPSQFVAERPDLLLLKAWLVYHRGHNDQLPHEIQYIERALAAKDLEAKETRRLQGETSALKSLLFFFQNNPQKTIAEAQAALRDTDPEVWIVRILARLYLAGAYQMEGDLQRAYQVIYQGVDEENLVSDRYRATMLVTVTHVYWIAADLPRVMAAARQSLNISNFPSAIEIRGLAHYHLGSVHYEMNELGAAERQFLTVTSRPYLNYGHNYVYSAIGLALAYQAQDRADEANQVVTSAIDYLVEINNTTLLPVVWAFQAELALRQGQTALADQWAAQFKSTLPIRPLIYMYQYPFTLVKIWMADDTPSSMRQATELLDQLQQYTTATHNTHALAKVMALKAVLAQAENDEIRALEWLQSALELTRPGQLIRLYVDLGQPIAHLLLRLSERDRGQEYPRRILAAFPQQDLERANEDHVIYANTPPQLVEVLTPRELDVLELLAERLTNKEIAQELVISPGTVKTHTLNIYAKLGVKGRRQAVDQARELNLL